MPATNPATPAPETPSETQDAAVDYAALLVADDGAPDTAPDADAAEQPKDEAPGVTDDAAAAAAGGEGDDAAGQTQGDAADGGDGTGADDAAQAAAANKPQQPGTPDKALQKLQQEQAAINRKLDAIMAKADGGETLTAKDKADAQAAQKRLAKIREAMAGDDVDLLAHERDVAQALVEHDDDLGALKARLDRQEQELSELRAGRQRQAADDLWASHKQAYPGVAVEQVWGKATQDAAEMLGVDPGTADPKEQQLLANAATRLFHDRADAAAKAVKAKAPAAAPATRAPKTAADPTPNGGRVSQQQQAGVTTSATPPDTEARYVADALALVK